MGIKPYTHSSKKWKIKIGSQLKLCVRFLNTQEPALDDQGDFPESLLWKQGVLDNPLLAKEMRCVTPWVHPAISAGAGDRRGYPGRRCEGSSQAAQVPRPLRKTNEVLRVSYQLKTCILNGKGQKGTEWEKNDPWGSWRCRDREGRADWGQPTGSPWAGRAQGAGRRVGATDNDAQAWNQMEFIPLGFGLVGIYQPFFLFLNPLSLFWNGYTMPVAGTV